MGYPGEEEFGNGLTVHCFKQWMQALGYVEGPGMGD